MHTWCTNSRYDVNLCLLSGSLMRTCRRYTKKGKFIIVILFRIVKEQRLTIHTITSKYRKRQLWQYVARSSPFLVSHDELEIVYTKFQIDILLYCLAEIILTS